MPCKWGFIYKWGGGDVTQFDASYTMAINGHENRFTIYIFLHHYYCKGNDRSVLKIFSGLAKSVFFKNKYLTWGGQDIGNLNDGRITYNIGEDRFINWGSLPLWKLSNLCTYFEL